MTSDIIMELSAACGIGHHTQAVEIAETHLKKYMPVKRIFGNSIAGIMKGKSDRTILFDAHCDEVGFIVISVDDSGFAKVGPIGTVDARILPSKPVVIYGRREVKAVFGSVPPHLKTEGDKPADFDSLFIDTGLGKGAAQVIAPGDYATFEAKPAKLAGGKICGKSLDNRAGVAALIKTAELLDGKELPCSIGFLISSGEELGMRGARTAAFELSPDSAVVVDVSFGNCPGIAEDKCRSLGTGAMIGISPVLSRRISDMLFSIAKENNIANTAEVMAGTTSTNADVISTTGAGVPCGLVSIPLRNMHTCAETVEASDIEAVAGLLAEYALKGGTHND